MPEQIIRDRVVETLKTAASWPGADKATIVTLATVLAAAGADAEGLSYFEALAAANPDQVLPLALAGFFGVRAGQDRFSADVLSIDVGHRGAGSVRFVVGDALRYSLVRPVSPGIPGEDVGGPGAAGGEDGLVGNPAGLSFFVCHAPVIPPG